MGRPSTWQIIILLLIILLLFGAPKLPELARSIGTSLRILKDETKQLTSDDDKDGPSDSDSGRKEPPADNEARDK